MKTSALDKLIVAVLDAGGKINKKDRVYLYASLNGRTVVVYHDGSYHFDFAFEKVGKNDPRPATLRTVKAVRAFLGI